MIQVMSTLQCAICAFAIPGLKIRKCSLCQMRFHQVCYFENRSRPSPDCQACAHVMQQKKGKKQKLQPVCFICNLNDGLLKEVSSNKFGHVLCVLTSKNIKMESYKQFTITQKQPAVTSICQQCKKQSSHLIECQLCSYRAHLACLPSEQQYVGQNLLENLKQNNLMQIALSCSAQDQTIKLILKCKPDWKDYNRQYKKLAICPKQSKKYCWCFCGNPSLNDQQTNPSILCDGCNRYVHLSCTGMKDPDQIKSYYCPGCKTGDKYKRHAKLPDLIQQIIRLEQANFKLSDLRTIDSFPYIFSNKLIKNLIDQKQKLINYLAIKAISQMANPKNKGEKIGHNHFYELIKDIIGSNAKQKSKSEVWEMYCQMLNRLDPSNSIAVSLMKPPQSQESERQNRMNQLQKQLEQHIAKLNDLIEDNAVAQIPNILRYLSIIRHAIHKSIEIKTTIQQNMSKNLLFAFILFWCSSKNQEKILQILLNNYLKKTKITIRQLQKLKTLKRKGCPHFKSDPAWDLIQGSLEVCQDQQIKNQKHQYEESKIQEKQNGNDQIEAETIIAKAIQNRQFNSKIYGVLKKKINRQGFETEKRSLKIFYQWSVLSKKIYFGLEKRKMSISGINQTWKLMKKCQYPKNQMKNKIQALFEYIKPVRKLMKKLQIRKRMDKSAEQDMELYQFLCKPTLQQIRQCIFKLRQSKYQEVWGDLQIYELQQILIKHQQFQARVKNIIEVNEHKFNTVNLQQKQNSTQSAENQQHKQILDPQQALELKRKIKQSSISFVHVNQLYKINDLVISAETTLKKRKWQAQKISEVQNQKQLINDLSKIIKQINGEAQFQNLTYNDILSNQQFEKKVIEKLHKQDQNKAIYLNKHITRNKKWLEDLKHLKNGAIKTMTFQDVSYLQQKLRTSIFDLTKAIQQVIIPSKRKCIDIRQRLQQIVPYCQQLPSNLTMRENIYNPQNKLYKQIRQLTVKDYVIKIYEKDCEMLKNLSSLQQKLSKKFSKQDFPLLLQQFQDTYKRLTPYLHQVKTVWDLIFKIFTKIIELYNQMKSQFNKNQKFLILQKYKRLVKMLDRFVDVNDCPENKRKMEELQQLLKQKYTQI